MEGTTHPEPVRGLTLSQRFHFDSQGFVLLKGALSKEQAGRMRDALLRLRAEPDLSAHGVYVNAARSHHWHVGNLVALAAGEDRAVTVFWVGAGGGERGRERDRLAATYRRLQEAGAATDAERRDFARDWAKLRSVTDPP